MRGARLESQAQMKARNPQGFTIQPNLIYSVEAVAHKFGVVGAGNVGKFRRELFTMPSERDPQKIRIIKEKGHYICDSNDVIEHFRRRIDEQHGDEPIIDPDENQDEEDFDEGEASLD